MSVFKLNCFPGAEFDSRYIQAVDIVVQNRGDLPFDILTQGYINGNIFARSLHHLDLYPQTGSIVTIADLRTEYMPFSFEFVTNIMSPIFTDITIFAKNNGSPIAIINKEQLTIADPN
ncbi:MULTISPECIES: hypothetical protein [unclassified Paenibacillus]|uniref:hypothetical protein n=1 Tax=unclassified Paenibacillus TaxID=185978 RepID=UPI001C0FA4CF|nr:MULTISPECIES: hypothetical protein [unclassified Paenibacillus]MBU5440824.1 hypothetical protein [Paenibacillus sp. MSJ-34]CAH0118479.1 hypothetical protein PAE9249_00968 [Paenibacillus sp. CECT 9249]